MIIYHSIGVFMDKIMRDNKIISSLSFSREMSGFFEDGEKFTARDLFQDRTNIYKGVR